MLQASVTGLAPKHAYYIALAASSDGHGTLQPLASFMTNPAGAAIVDSVGPIRQVVESSGSQQRRFLVVVEGTPGQAGSVVQVQPANK